MSPFYRFFSSNSYVRRVNGPPPSTTQVLQPSLTNPVLRMTGPGVPVQRNSPLGAGSAFSPICPPQQYLNDTWALQGLGGLSAGMRYTYPLSTNPLNQNASPQ